MCKWFNEAETLSDITVTSVSCMAIALTAAMFTLVMTGCVVGTIKLIQWVFL